MRRFSACVTTVAASVISSNGASGAEFYQTPVEKYTWTSSYPQSCKCVENGVSKSSCDMFRCNCMCDLTAGKCDYNCCCDPDCTSAQTDIFRSDGTCAYEGAPSSIEYCYSSSDLYGVNPRSPMGGQSTTQQAVGNALCVSKKNGEIQNDYYTNSDTKASSVFSQAQGKKDFSYVEVASTDNVLGDSEFQQYDTIPAFELRSGTYRPYKGVAKLPVPYPDYSGMCNDRNYALFESVPATNSTCRRLMSKDPSTFSSQCESKYSIAQLVTDIHIAINADSDASSSSITAAKTVDCTLSSVSYEDFATGETMTITDEWAEGGCATEALTDFSWNAYAGQVSQNTSCHFGTNATLNLATAGGATVLCTNFAKRVDYLIEYAISSVSDKQEVSACSAAVVLTDVPNGDEGIEIFVQQKFSIDYASGDASDGSYTNGNLNFRHRSGNPGYIYGKPVLFGKLDGTDNVIRQVIEGFAAPSSFTPFDSTLPSTFGLGRCPTTDFTAVAGLYDDYTDVEFGYDFVSGCTVSLTRSQLADFCCTGSELCSASSQSIYSASNGMPYFLNVSSGGYIGVYGNSDPSDVDQWIPMDVTVPEVSRVWSASTSTCANMFTGMNIKFLVARTGEKVNPQNKIVSALTEITTEDLVWRDSYLDTDTAVMYPLKVTVSFIFIEDGKVKGYAPPAPPVLFTVPYDVFYPFYTETNSAASQSGADCLWLTVGCLLATAVVLIL